MLTAREGVERLAGRCRWGSVPRVPDSKLVPLGGGGNLPVGVLDAYVQVRESCGAGRPGVQRGRWCFVGHP